MPYFVHCPRCQVRLRVRDDLPGTEFSCPRCLAIIPAAGETEAVDAIQTALPAGPTPPRLPGKIHADADIRRDIGTTTRALVVMALLLLGSLVLTVFSGMITGQGFVGRGEKNRDTLITLTLLGSGLLTLAAPLPFVIRALRHSNLGVGRIVLSGVMYIGIVGAAVMALFVIFFLACLSGLTIK